MLDLRPATREVARLLEGVTDDQLSAPSPSDCDVATLLDHLMGLTLAFTWAAEKSAAEHGPTGPGRSSAKALDPDWRSVLPGRLDALADAWSKPSAWEGMTEAGGVTMPGEVTGLVALDEVVLHGWDLARATGHEFSCEPGCSGRSSRSPTTRRCSTGPSASPAATPPGRPELGAPWCSSSDGARAERGGRGHPESIPAGLPRSWALARVVPHCAARYRHPFTQIVCAESAAILLVMTAVLAQMILTDLCRRQQRRCGAVP